MVRLKEKYASAAAGLFAVFQFQSGAVKRWCQNWRSLYLQKFQFQSGAVKSLYASLNDAEFIVFQFQSGAVKSG